MKVILFLLRMALREVLSLGRSVDQLFVGLGRWPFALTKSFIGATIPFAIAAGKRLWPMLIAAGRWWWQKISRVSLLGIKDTLTKTILLAIAPIGIASVIYLVNPWIILATLIMLAAIAGGLLFVVWNFLAPSHSNRFFTFVNEGTAKVIVLGDRFAFALIQWRGHTLDGDWNVVSDGIEIGGKVYKERWHPFGGLRFYGLWPLWDVFIYDLRWNDLQQSEAERGERTGVKFHEERLDYILLKPDVYWTKLTNVETKPPERIPVSVELLMTMQVVNVYKVMFVAPINWVENVIARSDALFRGFISNLSLDELLKTKGRDEAMKKLVQDKDLFTETFLEEWGIKVHAVQIRSIEIAPAYAEAAAAQKVAEMHAKGQRERIRLEYKTIEEFGELGKLVRTLEAIERSQLAASLTVQAVPGLQELLRGVFGKSDAASEDIRELKEMVKKVLESREDS